LGAHVLACGGAKALDDASHNLVRDALLAACTEAGFRAIPEPPGLIDDTRERPADVWIAAGYGIGTQANATKAAALDCCGCRLECATAMQDGPVAAMKGAHNYKKNRVFPHSSEAGRAAAEDGERAAAACLAAGGSAGESDAARTAARRRALEARQPPIFVVPIVFGSCGGFYDGEPRLGLRAVMDALAARHKAGEGGRAEGVGGAAVHDRWVPHLATALLERGVWRRFARLLRDLQGGLGAGGRLALSYLSSKPTAPLRA